MPPFRYSVAFTFSITANRRDPATAALDTFVLSRRPTGIGRLYHRAAWIFCVFLGGFFVHTLISFVLFLVVPTRLSQRISPCFAGSAGADRLRAWGELAAALAVHLFPFRWLGMSDFVVGFVLPLIPFAWVFSLLLYIYHYRVASAATCGTTSARRRSSACFLGCCSTSTSTPRITMTPACRGTSSRGSPTSFPNHSPGTTMCRRCGRRLQLRRGRCCSSATLASSNAWIRRCSRRFVAPRSPTSTPSAPSSGH